MIGAARLNSSTPKAGRGFALDVITAVVIGGASMSGGIGKIFGVVVGALIKGVMNNGMSMLGIGIDYQQVIKGLVLLAAVIFDVCNKSKQGKYGAYLSNHPPDGTPRRVGWALANEVSDPVAERINDLFLAHSKLREAAFGPMILVGDLPADIRGTSRIRRDGAVIWENPCLWGEANLSHTLANLDHHHFKSAVVRQPGNVHMFGTATLSFADSIRTQIGDVFEIAAPIFGLRLKNPLAIARADDAAVAVQE